MKIYNSLSPFPHNFCCIVQCYAKITDKILNSLQFQNLRNTKHITITIFSLQNLHLPINEKQTVIVKKGLGSKLKTKHSVILKFHKAFKRNLGSII